MLNIGQVEKIVEKRLEECRIVGGLRKIWEFSRDQENAECSEVSKDNCLSLHARL